MVGRLTNIGNTRRTETYGCSQDNKLLLECKLEIVSRGVKLISTEGHSSLTVALTGPDVTVRL